MKIDLGCGNRKVPDHVGVDRIAFPGVDVVLDVGKDAWPWADGSVEEVYCSHLIEHLEPMERVHLVNESYRVLQKGGKLTVIGPHWASGRAYGDMTHKWPPFGESWIYHTNAAWRAENSPHETFYSCDFDPTFGYSLNAVLQGRNQEYVQFALSHYKEAAMDIMATFVKNR